MTATSHTMIELAQLVERALSVLQYADYERTDGSIRLIHVDRQSIEEIRAELCRLQKKAADSLADEKEVAK